MLRVEPPLPARPRDELVFQKDHFRCVYCDFDGSSFDGWTFLVVDHFVPRSRGGTDTLINLVTACVICNNMKGAFAFSDLTAARASITQWRAQMREYWHQNVESLLDAEPTASSKL